MAPGGDLAVDGVLSRHINRIVMSENFDNTFALTNTEYLICNEVISHTLPDRIILDAIAMDFSRS
jgi:hypothetical protein